MRYSIEKAEKYTVFSLDEEKFDTLIAPNVKAEVTLLYQGGVNNLICDLSKVKYIDSSGLSALLLANRYSNELGGCLVLVGISEHVMKLISITRLDRVFEMLPTVEEAVDFVFMHELEKDLKKEGGQP